MHRKSNQRTASDARQVVLGIAGGKMPPEKELAVVPAVEYKMEYRSHADDAWYTAGVLMEGEALRIKYYNFSDDVDSIFERSDFRSLKEIEEFSERFRALSRQVQDDECGQLVNGTKVCASFCFSNEEVRFYDALVEGVLKSKHSYKEEEPTEELCLCTFILFWLHGPNAGKLTNAKIDSICIVEPSFEIDPVVLSFLKMAREKKKPISSSSVIMSERAPGREMGAHCDDRPKSARKLGYFERMQKDKRCARRSVVEVCSPGGSLLSHSRVSNDDRRTDDSDLDGVKKACILVGNLDKQLCPSTVTEFLHRHTSVSASVFIYPSLPSEMYTTGAIMLDSEKEFQKLCNFLNNPNQIITSSTGRPWVIIEKLVGLNKIKASIGTLEPISKNMLQKEKSGTTNDLKIVRSGTREFKIASDLRVLFSEFSDHQERLHRRLYLEETKISAAR